jgi:hypothetical protein
MPTVATHFAALPVLNPTRARGGLMLVTNNYTKWLGSKKRVERADARGRLNN